MDAIESNGASDRLVFVVHSSKRNKISSSKNPKRGSGNGNKAQAAGGTVVDVSLCGDDCSTRSQPELSSQSRQGRRREVEYCWR